VWLLLSTIGVFVAFWVFLLDAKNSRSARINVVLCLVEVVAFFFYCYRILTSGLLDFG